MRGRQEGARTVALNGAIRCGYTRYPAPIRSESTDTPFIRCNALQCGCSWSGAASHRAPPSGPLPWSCQEEGPTRDPGREKIPGKSCIRFPVLRCREGRGSISTPPPVPCHSGGCLFDTSQKKGLSDQFLRKINPLWFKILPESSYPEAGEDQLPGQ